MVTEPARVLLGDVEVTRVPEYAGKSAATPGFLFPDSSPGYWADNAGWLDPDFYDAAKGTLRTVLHSWLIRSQGMIIVLDTGAATARNAVRAGLRAPRHGLSGQPPGGGRAAAGRGHRDQHSPARRSRGLEHPPGRAGLGAHLSQRPLPHLRAGFPVLGSGPRARPPGDGNQNVFEDSVRPLQRAGLIDLSAGEHRINSELVLRAAAGHTPGSSVLRLQSGGTGALFVGDILHSPAQIGDPDVNSCFCEDPAMARAARRRLLAEAADRSMLVFPGTSAGIPPAAWAMTATAPSIIRDWADLARI